MPLMFACNEVSVPRAKAHSKVYHFICRPIRLDAPMIISVQYSVGAKSQILSSVAPTGKETWLLFSVRDMSWGLRNPCFTKFCVVNFL